MSGYEVSGLYKDRWRIEPEKIVILVSQNCFRGRKERWRRFQNIGSGEQEIVLLRAKRENGQVKMFHVSFLQIELFFVHEQRG
jgi:hypothetical protein